MTDLPFLEANPDPTRPERAPRRHVHRWGPGTYSTVDIPVTDGVATLPDGRTVAAADGVEVVRLPVLGPDLCVRCGRPRDAAASRRGRTNRSRGNAIEREVGRKLGLRRVGQFGGPDDLSGEMFSVQVKSGAAFPERLWTWLKAVPANAGQTPLLVVTDAPGPGHRRRAVVVLELEEWVALHGPTEGDTK